MKILTCADLDSIVLAAGDEYRGKFSVEVYTREANTGRTIGSPNGTKIVQRMVRLVIRDRAGEALAAVIVSASELTQLLLKA